MLEDRGIRIDKAYAVRGVVFGVPCATITFQEGPLREVGVNGCQVEDLLEICHMRLMEFQKGLFPCKDNEDAIEAIEKAVKCL
jgi:hypothetical protein